MNSSRPVSEGRLAIENDRWCSVPGIEMSTYWPGWNSRPSSSSTSPSSRNDLQAEHCPSLQPCMSWMPLRNAPRRTVSSSSTSNSIPTGSSRTVCFSPICHAVRLVHRQLLLRRRRASGGAAGLVLRDVLLALLGRHLVDEDVRALQRVAAGLVERPHLLRVQVQVRLRDERVPVVADVPELLHDLRDVHAVVERLPLALAGQLAHGRRRAALVLRAERDLVGPVAGLRAVRPDLAVDLVGHHVLADQAGDHAAPAAVRVLVAGPRLERDRLVAVAHGVVRVALPPLAVLVVPARVLVLEPLEVLVVHAVDPPVVGEPAGGEELGHLVDVALVPDPVPGLLDEVVRDRQAVLLERDEVGAVVVVVDPAPPHLGVGLAVLAAVLCAVLDERAPRGVC